MKTIRTSQLLTALLLLVSCTSSSGITGSASKPYPLRTCLVTGNDLDSMGGAVTKVYKGQEIKFCCKPCVKKFEANQAKYLARLP